MSIYNKNKLILINLIKICINNGHLKSGIRVHLRKMMNPFCFFCFNLLFSYTHQYSEIIPGGQAQEIIYGFEFRPAMGKVSDLPAVP